MKRSDLLKEFERHRDEIQVAYQERMNALYTLYPEFAPQQATPGAGTGKFNVTKAIRQALDNHLGENFNTEKMEEWLFTTYPQNKNQIKRLLVSNTLYRMAHTTKEIDIVSSDRPVVYVKKAEKKDSDFKKGAGDVKE